MDEVMSFRWAFIVTLGALGLAVLVGVFQVLDEYRRRLARLKIVRGATVIGDRWQ